MKKVMLSLVALGLVAGIAASAEAGPFRWFRRGRPVYMQTAPTTARVETGYRSFSYQPAAGVGYRSFSYQPAVPAVGYRTPARPMTGGGHSFENVTNKALGRVN